MQAVPGPEPEEVAAGVEGASEPGTRNELHGMRAFGAWTRQQAALKYSAGNPARTLPAALRD
jgi:hypothetical protein